MIEQLRELLQQPHIGDVDSAPRRRLEDLIANFVPLFCTKVPSTTLCLLCCLFLMPLHTDKRRQSSGMMLHLTQQLQRWQAGRLPGYVLLLAEGVQLWAEPQRVRPRHMVSKLDLICRFISH